MLAFDQFRVITFDCYGTLIDWETGILNALQPIMRAHGCDIDDVALLRMYGEVESRIEDQGYRPYRQVLREVAAAIGSTLDFSPSEEEMEALPKSLSSWEPFPDTVPALRQLRKVFKLGVISNIDNDLFAASAKKLQVPLDYVVTAEEAHSYKPSHNNFNIALKKIGLPATHILHVAESLHHDVAPTRSMGIKNVWVNRTTKRGAFGATRPADTEPDLQVPDLMSLARLAVGGETQIGE